MTSLSAAAGRRLTAPQYQVLARLKRGEDLRSWQIHPTTLQALARRGLVDCRPPACRLELKGEPRSPSRES